MRSPWATRQIFEREPLARFASLLALFGFLFTTTTPGLALVNAAGQSLAVGGFLGVYVCHAQGGKASLPGETSGPSDECCLVCQAAQLANGAVPPQHFTLPTESAAAIRLSASAQDRREGTASRHAQARAPPAA